MVIPITEAFIKAEDMCASGMEADSHNATKAYIEMAYSNEGTDNKTRRSMCTIRIN